MSRYRIVIFLASNYIYNNTCDVIIEGIICITTASSKRQSENCLASGCSLEQQLCVIRTKGIAILKCGLMCAYVCFIDYQLNRDCSRLHSLSTEVQCMHMIPLHVHACGYIIMTQFLMWQVRVKALLSYVEHPHSIAYQISNLLYQSLHSDTCTTLLH